MEVASPSRPNSVAGVLEEHGCVEVHIIGANAVNQTVEAVVVAHRLVKKSEGESIKVIPGFMKLSITEDERAGIRFIIEKSLSSRSN